MIIFVKQITPRLTYAFHFVITEQLGIDFAFTTDVKVFESANTPKINYSDVFVASGFQILPNGILFEEGIAENKPEISYINNLPIIFNNENCAFGFDIFSAAFWFVSRYEEYQNFNADSHGRFPATESFAYKNNLLKRAIVDEWVQFFGTKLKTAFSEIIIKKNEFKAVTTIDIDSPWCYKHKGWARNAGGLLRDASKGKTNDIVLRIKVLCNLKPDPWHNLNWVLEQHQKTSVNLMFFIHVGNFGKYDKTVNYLNKAFVNFVQNLKASVNLGLHPSYQASQNVHVFKTELARLSRIAGYEIKKSRQHFLVISIPKYYQMLNELGIEDDYTMGFADKAGFRAGTSKPFYFFDLNKNEQTKLSIHPFAVMDRTLNSYEGQSITQALDTLKELIDEVKKVNGTFVSLWHNESLSDLHEWKGWRQGFKTITAYLASLQ